MINTPDREAVDEEELLKLRYYLVLPQTKHAAVVASVEQATHMKFSYAQARSGY